MNNKPHLTKLDVKEKITEKSQSTFFNKNQLIKQTIEFKSGLENIPDPKPNEFTSLNNQNILGVNPERSRIEEDFDDLSKAVSKSTVLKFGKIYAMNRYEDKNERISNPNYDKNHEIQNSETNLMPKNSNSSREELVLKTIEIKPSPNAAEEEKYKGKEGEYGLGHKEWHKFSEIEMIKELEGNPNGLTDSEHEIKIRQYGYNRITPKKTHSWFVKLIINMLGGFQLFLWVGGFLCIIVYFITNFTDYQTLALGLICIMIVIGTSLFQTYQEGKSNDVMAALKALTPDKVLVYRNSKEILTDSMYLVPGDIINVKKGDKVPADVRVLESNKLKVNNASLTGENVDINLHGNPEVNTIYEAKNIARMGCNFTNGTGKCIVFSTGDDTFFGHIAKSTLNIKRPDSCLTKEVKRLVNIMGVISIVLGVIFLILALLKGYKAVDAVIFMIGIIIANVPEGLLPQMTVALALTARKMQSKGVVVTNLEIIETLGAVNVICSDKTGTLTCNRMTVSHLAYDSTIFGADTNSNSAKNNVVKNEENIKNSKSGKENHEKIFDQENSSFKELLKIMAVNTNAKFEPGQDAVPVLNRTYKDGDASEGALIKFIEPIKNIEEYRKEYKIIHEIPFNSTNKWMLKIIQSKSNPNENNGKYTFLLKGAPEKVLNFCDYYLQNGKINKIEAEDYERIIKLNEDLANKGERVLGFASKISEEIFPENFEFREDSPFNFKHNSGFVFVGLTSLIDPPRDNVFESIQKCKIAGIQVFMVTGDQPLTALSIAKKLNLVTDENNEIQEKKSYVVVNGVELLNFTQEDWDKILEYKEIVFARTMPQQKQDIVNQLKAKNKIIAMTGDGVNDAPALKAAHVGIAMGSGASVAKEAGQLILSNDDFSNIVDGVEEGRLIFENLKKCVCYVLTSNIPQLIPFLLFIILKIPLGIETIMIILIPVGTDLFPAISLAWEKEEDQTMRLPPRTSENHLVGFKLILVSYLYLGVLQTFTAYWAWYWVFYDFGFSFTDLLGTGISIRESWENMNDVNRSLFAGLCTKNVNYQRDMVLGLGMNCQQDFMGHLVKVLAIAQSSYLMTVVWTQMTFIFIRKTQSETIFNKKRLLNNIPLYWALLMELISILIFVYIPGLNNALLLAYVKPVYACSALWCLPILILFEEIRKYFCRNYPTGCVAKMTKF